MPKIDLTRPLLAAFAVAFATLAAHGADPPPAKPAGKDPFGIKPEGVTSPAMRDALTRLQEAGVVEGRRGTLTFFRWTDDDPPKLAHLGLWGSKVGNEHLALIPILTDLEHVSLYETNVDDEGVLALTRLPKLKTLAITPVVRYEKAGYGPPQWSYPFLAPRPDRPRVTGKAVKALASIPTLTGLDLMDVRLTSADLGPVAAMPGLSVLSLPNPIDDETVAHLQACRKLTALRLGGREVAADELGRLGRWKALRKLTLTHARLSDEALRAVSKLESLEELHLEDCGLTDERLKHLGGPPKLSSLALERNEIAGPGLAHLTGLKLKTLGLEFNNIDDATLSHLPQLTTVENLWLSYCRGVTDAGIRGGTLQGMTHLKHLRLRGMKRVTDASLDDLVKFGHLDDLTVRETGISWDGVARMRKAMPTTTVFK